MARVKGFGRITKGKLGDNGFRQQLVKENGRYVKRTIIFQLPEGNTSNTVRQATQRSKFRLVQQLATALNAKGILRNFYNSGSLLPGYNKFISDHLRNDYAIHVSGDQNFLDWKKVLVTKGSSAKKVKAYAVDGADASGQKVSEDGCNCEMKLAWNYSHLTDGPGTDWVLQLVSVKVDADGNIEDVLYEQPLVTMNQCMTDVTLPKCDCCKTYWFAFFVNPSEGLFTTSNYLGTCTCELGEYDDSCMTCEQAVQVEYSVIPPSDCPTACGDGEGVDPSTIIYNGNSNLDGTNPNDLVIIVPDANAVTEPCDMGVAVTSGKVYSYTISNVGVDIDINDGEGNSGTVVFSDAATMKDSISTLLGIATDLVAVNANLDATFNIVISRPDTAYTGMTATDTSGGDPITILESSMTYLSFVANDSDALITVTEGGVELGSETGTLEIVKGSGTSGDFNIQVSKDGCDTLTVLYRLSADGSVAEL